ncbi:hypothetical protein ACYOEI_20430, partial [Singulisphaera rosea]
MIDKLAVTACQWAERTLPERQRADIRADLARRGEGATLSQALYDEGFRGSFYFRCKCVGLFGRVLLRVASLVLPGPSGLALSEPI